MIVNYLMTTKKRSSSFKKKTTGDVTPWNTESTCSAPELPDVSPVLHKSMMQLWGGIFGSLLHGDVWL